MNKDKSTDSKVEKPKKNKKGFPKGPDKNYGGNNRGSGKFGSMKSTIQPRGNNRGR